MRALKCVMLPGLLLAVATASGHAGGDTPVEISGYLFGDLYVVASHHNEELEGENGAWFRRIYLTFDHQAGDRVSARVRFEGNSPGDFETSSEIEPSVKDAYLKYSHEKHSAYFGISETPTWGQLEKAWAYRSVEKTPLDLQKLASSRDLGLAAKGPLTSNGKFLYHAMLGNGNSNKSETNEGKKGMLALAVKAAKGLLVEVYGDFENRPGETDRTTIQGFASYKTERATIGGMVAQQRRQVPGDGDDVDIGLVSVFGVATLNDRVKGLARYDHMLDVNPDAAKISYLPMDPSSKSRLLIAGVDIAVAEGLNVIPNVEVVFYSGVDGAESPDADVIPRITLFGRF